MILLQDRIYKVYTRYTPSIYYAYTIQRTLAILLSCPSALGSLRPGLPSDLLGFGHREAVVIDCNYDIVNIYLSYQHFLYGISNKIRRYILIISMNMYGMYATNT
jgi:hypothetical protein